MKPYRISLSREKSIPQKAVVGEIAPPTGRTLKCEIVLDDAAVARYEMRDLFAALLPLKPLEVPHYRISVSEDCLKKLQKQDVTAFFKLYHELGHIDHGDLLPGQEAKADRFAQVAEGKVSEEERKADRFAMAYMGLENAIQALTEMREGLKAEGGLLPSEKRRTAMAELDLRIEELNTIYH